VGVFELKDYVCNVARKDIMHLTGLSAETYKFMSESELAV
jgi:hypothetical protein